MKNLSVGAFFGYIGMGILIVGVAVFLAGHSLNFFQISFKDGQQAYAPLGLLLTEGGLFIWLVIFLTIAKSNMQKAIALIMTVVSLVGGMATAIFDIYFETATGAAGFQLSIDEIKTMSLVVGALAVAHGLAMIFELAGNQIFDAFEIATKKDLNNDGRIGNSGSQNTRSNAPVSRPEAPRANNQQQGTSYTLAAFLDQSGMNTEQAFAEFLEETDTFSKAWQVLRDHQSAYVLPDGITHKNFNELAGKIHANGNFQKAAQ